MRGHRRRLIVVAVAAIAVGGCGRTGAAKSTSAAPYQIGSARKSGGHHTSRPAHRPPPTRAHIIDSFRARLVNYHVVRVHWALELEIAGVRHGSTKNQTCGGLPIKPSDADNPRAANEAETDRTDFEYGEYNFHDYDHLQFRLRARAPHRTFDTSQPVLLSRSKPR